MSAGHQLRANAPGATLLEQIAAARLRIKRLQLELHRVGRSRDQWKAEAMEWRHAFDAGALTPRKRAQDRRYRKEPQ